jgi:conjugative transfer pilus assembly protein TraH
MKTNLKTIACCVALMAATQPVLANINQDMSDMFNSMGASANGTDAGAFKSQVGNVYSGGSLYVRFPNKSISLTNLALPSIRAGCGGIDFYAGSFSFANKEQFVAFTRNLGNNAVGVAFDLALSSLDPMVSDTIKGIRDMLNQLNSGSLNSCQDSKALVGGLVGSIAQNVTNSCSSTSAAANIGSDGSDSRAICQAAGAAGTAANRMTGDLSSEHGIEFTSGNIMYLALNKTDLSAEEKELLVSLSGTYTAQKPSDGGDNKINVGGKYHPPTIAEIKDLLQAENQDGSISDKKLTLLTCSSTDPNDTKAMDQCEPKTNVKVVSFSALVRNNINLLHDSIKENRALSANDLRKVKALIENTPLPLLKMAIFDTAQGTKLVTRKYENIIVYEYTKSWLERMSKDLDRPLSLITSRSPGEGEAIKNIHENIQRLRNKIQVEVNQEYAKAANETGIVRMLQEHSNKFFSAFPAIQNSILFGQNGQ